MSHNPVTSGEIKRSNLSDCPVQHIGDIWGQERGQKLQGGNGINHQAVWWFLMKWILQSLIIYF